MKLKKLKLNEIEKIELNEREMCRILGGGTPGCCQCGCKYVGQGGSSTSDNRDANDAYGLNSDYSAQPCCDSGSGSDSGFTPQSGAICDYNGVGKQDALCGGSQGYSCGI